MNETVIPDGWVIRSLEGLASFIGRGQGPTYVEEDTGLTAINQKCVRNGKVTPKNARPHKINIQLKPNAILQQGDVCINSTGTGTIGRVGLWCQPKNGTYFVDSHVTIVRPLPDKADSKILTELLNSVQLQNALETYCFTGSTNQVELNRSSLLKLKIVISNDLKEQQEIAKILTTVDDLIEKTEALIEKYQAIKQGMMHDLFNRGIDSNGQLRPSHHDAPHLYKNSEQGWIPKDWFLVLVDNIAEKVTDGDHHTPDRSEHGIYLLSARNVLDGKLALDDVDYVPEHEYKRMIKRCHPEHGDILISCSGTIGRVCAVPENFQCALVRSAALVKLNKELALSRFMEWVFRSSYIQVQINAAMLQAAQPNLFQGAIKKLVVKLAPLAEQRRVSLRLDSVESKARKEAEYLQSLIQIKKGLMQDLLTGKVRIN